MKKRSKAQYSALAASITAILSSSVSTQEATTEPENTEENEQLVEVIDVRGTRQDLFNAQNLKRYSDTVVDALDASDIGSFPDRSVLEAISRLPGVTIGRFAAPNDPDHFGTEGSGVNIRGLTFVRSEFNGRDSFTADSGRGLSFQDVPPELVGSVEVFKNVTSDCVEGGVAGIVNLITRKPFDQEGEFFAFSADVTYADFIKESTPTMSALYSNEFMTDVGRFGFLVNASYSDLDARSDGAQVGEYLSQDGGTTFLPETMRFTRKEDERVRRGFAAVVQWDSLDNTTRATAEYVRSDSSLAWTERSMEYQDQNTLLRLMELSLNLTIRAFLNKAS